MKYITFLTLALALLFSACHSGSHGDEHAVHLPQNSQLAAGNPGAKLVQEMMDALGGLEAYHQLKDVEYTYIYRDAKTGQQDVSLERYIYNGELSWAKYNEHTKSVFPDQPGEVIQSFDGENTWVSLNGEVLTDPKAIGLSDFLRKTNYYWLNMMFKLLDPGTQFERQPDRNVNGVDYKIVEVSFGENVGDAQDIYLLYLNPKTKLVDQFLFTVMDFGRSEPLLMEVKYEEVNGLKWPTYRRYAPANWQGELAEEATWIEEISRDLKFDNGFKASLFSSPN